MLSEEMKRDLALAAACTGGVAVLLAPASVVTLALGLQGSGLHQGSAGRRRKGMKIVVVKSPKALRGILRRLFHLK